MKTLCSVSSKNTCAPPWPNASWRGWALACWALLTLVGSLRPLAAHARSAGTAEEGQRTHQQLRSTTQREQLATTSHRTATGGTDLLAPLGSDSAIGATLKPDSPLRRLLWQIATDTTHRGYVAGQAALGHYLGYKFGP